MIVQSWVKHISKVLYVERAITWGNIPGYKQILKALFEELQNRNLHFYADSLVEAISAFLSNPKILNAVVKITFSKTSV